MWGRLTDPGRLARVWTRATHPARDGREDLDFGGKLITVRSETGRKEWIIDCQSSAAAGAGGGGLGLDAHPYLAIR